jgi:nucleoside-diphosphate-sugar epimerase
MPVHKRKPDYNAAKNMQELMDAVCAFYGEPYDDRNPKEKDVSIRDVAAKFNITDMKARKILITANLYSTSTSRKVQELAAAGRKGIHPRPVPARLRNYEVSIMGKQHIDLNNKTILVTGSPGFIGANLVLRLLKELSGGTVISLDNMNDYYDPKLKEYRLSLIEKAVETSPMRHVFIKGSIADKALVDGLFAEHKPAVVVNLAAQAGVRYSIDHPDVYIESNLIGFFNILEACRHNPVEHLVYASSSSVYGGSRKVPFSTEDMVDNPVSLYAATKKSNELLAHSYSKLYNIPSTGLRFFTVYGPAGRPDMFYYSATQKLVKGETISIFNYGNCQRDFTYVDDIVEGVLRVMQGVPEKATGDDGLPLPPYAVYNIGGGTPENLLDYISTLQEELVRAGVLPEDYDFEAHRELVGMQPGDVPVTYADSTGLERDYGFKPSIGIREGLRRFAQWYAGYYMNN